MKSKWTHLIVRVLPILAAVVVVAEELDQFSGRRWM